MKILTAGGWTTIENDDDVEKLTCCDCGQPAMDITESRCHNKIVLWAHCEVCAEIRRNLSKIMPKSRG